MAVVVVALLAVGTLGGKPPTLDERAHNLEKSIRCPSCASQAVANSDTPAAEAVRVLIRERLEAGDSDEEIRDYVASRYPDGRQLLLDPAGRGFGALVWAVPVVAAIAAVAGLVVRFGDWRPAAVTATDADRELVAAHLAARADQSVIGPTGGPEPSVAEPSVAEPSVAEPSAADPVDGPDGNDQEGA